MAGFTLEELQRRGAKPVRTGGLTLEQLNEMKDPGYFGRIGRSFKQEAGEIKSAVQTGAEAIQEGGPKAIPDVLRAGVRTAGSVAEAAFSPIFEIPVVKNIIGAVGERLLENPNTKQVIDKAKSLADKYPNQAKDFYDVLNIVSLGYAPRAVSAVTRETKAIGSDIAQGTKVVLSPTEAEVQATIVELFNKSIKPSTKNLAKGQKYENDVLSALKTIKANVDNLNIEDEVGELVARSPQSINELRQAVEQTKGLVFNQYDNLARQAGQQGATIDARPIADELQTVINNRALQLTNPEIIKYAEQWAERLQGFGELDTLTTQEVVKNLNKSLQAFYRNPSYDSATKAAIDEGIANNFRKALDDAIEGATGEQYQALKRQYGALRSIEDDVVRASTREARRNVKGLIDYTDIFTGGQMLGGIFSLEPAMFTKGAVERGIKEYIKFLNNPNRAVGNMFDMLDETGVQPFSPQSRTFQYLQNPRIGLSLEDVSKSSNSSNQSAKGLGTQQKVSNKALPNTTTKFLSYLDDKLAKNPNATLSRQEIVDFARRPELKKGEADLLLKKLEEFGGAQEGLRLYHGTTQGNFPFFRKPYAALETENTSSAFGRGIYFSDNPEYAKTFGETIKEVRLPNNLNFYDLRDTTRRLTKQEAASLNRAVKGLGVDPIKEGDLAGVVFDDIRNAGSSNQLTDVLQKAGYDGVRYQEIPLRVGYSDAPSAKALKEAWKDKSDYVVFDESIVNKGLSPDKLPAQDFADSIRRDLVEIDLKKEMGRMPIEAFGVVPFLNEDE